MKQVRVYEVLGKNSKGESYPTGVFFQEWEQVREFIRSDRMCHFGGTPMNDLDDCKYYQERIMNCYESLEEYDSKIRDKRFFEITKDIDKLDMDFLIEYILEGKHK
jgi:hypothetical protein